MNQIVSFKQFLIGKVMDGTKYYTTRLKTPYRLKLDVKDTMYIYTGIRTKGAKKHGEALVVRRWQWNQSLIQGFVLVDVPCPFDCNWITFSKAEGFDNPAELYDYFTQKEYVGKDLITYRFILQPTLEGY